MSQNPPCESCAHVHDSSWTVAVGRFEPKIPTRYRATYPDSTIWGAREAAEADMCAHLRSQA